METNDKIASIINACEKLVGDVADIAGVAGSLLLDIGSLMETGKDRVRVHGPALDKRTAARVNSARAKLSEPPDSTTERRLAIRVIRGSLLTVLYCCDHLVDEENLPEFVWKDQLAVVSHVLHEFKFLGIEPSQRTLAAFDVGLKDWPVFIAFVEGGLPVDQAAESVRLVKTDNDTSVS